MGYMHIENLYRPSAQVLFNFKNVYVLEKVHGTSAHILFKVASQPEQPEPVRVSFFAGGVSHEAFVKLFDTSALLAKFEGLSSELNVTVYGEAYGGSCQGMSATYGKALQFIAFDVRVGERWLTVPEAAEFAEKLGLEFVPWYKVAADETVLNEWRDRPSEVAARRGCGNDKTREGVVIRPLAELTDSWGNRVMAKHKGAAFSERKNVPKPGVDLTVLANAEKIASEWVVMHRLEHVVSKLQADPTFVLDVTSTKRVIDAMVEDVLREGSGEIVDSKEARGAIGKRTAALFKTMLNTRRSDA